MQFPVLLHPNIKQSKSLGRILGIDYGGKRTGLAWTDTMQISINPLPTCPTSTIESRLKELLDTGEVTETVFGLPSHMDGTITSIGEKVMKLAKALEEKYPKVKFALIDEAFTSRDARQMLILSGVRKKKRQEKSNVDQMSAMLILRDYINNK